MLVRSGAEASHRRRSGQEDPRKRAANSPQRNLIRNPIKPTPKRKRHREMAAGAARSRDTGSYQHSPMVRRQREAPRRFPTPCRGWALAAEAARSARLGGAALLSVRSDLKIRSSLHRSGDSTERRRATTVRATRALRGEASRCCDLEPRDTEVPLPDPSEDGPGPPRRRNKCATAGDSRLGTRSGTEVPIMPPMVRAASGVAKSLLEGPRADRVGARRPAMHLMVQTGQLQGFSPPTSPLRSPAVASGKAPVPFLGLVPLRDLSPAVGQPVSRVSDPAIG
jgi:hypothetical protein